MPVHDWKKVDAGIFHHFHLTWISEICRALNQDVLPEGYYALGEQIAGTMGPDVLTLQRRPASRDRVVPPEHGVLTVAAAPPKVRTVTQVPELTYTARQRSVAIRHRSNHRLIALIEIVSWGNKQSTVNLRAFVAKAVRALRQHLHLMIVDLFAPTKRDPQGIHGLLMAKLAGQRYRLPADKPLTIASYDASDPLTAYVNNVAVGDPLPDMPLFLDAELYVSTPLEATYQRAWDAVPEYWREVLESRTQ